METRVVMETAALFICREAVATSPNSTGGAVHIGSPLPEALWRTNHGYDPFIRKNFEWSQAPDSNSVARYFLIYNSLMDYAANSTLIGQYHWGGGGARVLIYSLPPQSLYI